MAKLKQATRKAQVFDAEAFGKALKSKRTIQNSYTTRDLADILSLPHSTISRMERCLPAELSSILVVCDWLGQSLCYFIVYEKKEAFPIIFQEGTITIKTKGRKNKKTIKFLSNHSKQDHAKEE